MLSGNVFNVSKISTAIRDSCRLLLVNLWEVRSWSPFDNHLAQRLLEMQARSRKALSGRENALVLRKVQTALRECRPSFMFDVR